MDKIKTETLSNAGPSHPGPRWCVPVRPRPCSPHCPHSPKAPISPFPRPTTTDVTGVHIIAWCTPRAEQKSWNNVSCENKPGVGNKVERPDSVVVLYVETCSGNMYCKHVVETCQPIKCSGKNLGGSSDWFFLSAPNIWIRVIQRGPRLAYSIHWRRPVGAVVWDPVPGFTIILKTN